MEFPLTAQFAVHFFESSRDPSSNALILKEASASLSATRGATKGPIAGTPFRAGGALTECASAGAHATTRPLVRSANGAAAVGAGWAGGAQALDRRQQLNGAHRARDGVVAPASHWRDQCERHAATNAIDCSYSDVSKIPTYYLLSGLAKAAAGVGTNYYYC
eukprot:3177885-Pleurochrysis_carterae.AAC.1